jgi:hypothetical protein
VSESWFESWSSIVVGIEGFDKKGCDNKEEDEESYEDELPLLLLGSSMIMIIVLLAQREQEIMFVCLIDEVV